MHLVWLVETKKDLFINSPIGTIPGVTMKKQYKTMRLKSPVFARNQADGRECGSRADIPA